MYYNGVLLVGKRNHMLTECKICARASHVVLLIPKSLPDLHLAERTSPGVASHSCFPIIFPISVNDNSIPPGIQAKDFRVILDSFTSHIQFINKSFCFTFDLYLESDYSSPLNNESLNCTDPLGCGLFQ